MRNYLISREVSDSLPIILYPISYEGKTQDRSRLIEILIEINKYYLQLLLYRPEAIDKSPQKRNKSH